MKEIYIKHKDWNGICVINDNKIYRKEIIDEQGFYNIKINQKEMIFTLF